MLGRQTTTLFSAALLFLAAWASAEPITGKVASADPEAQTLTLEDGRTVRVGPGDARIGYVGQEIRGELDPMTDPPTLYAIWPNNSVDRQVEQSVNKQLHTDTVTQGRKAFRGLGDYLPDFALYNQNGELVRKHTYRGKLVVYNFIFTRCQMPNMCPASTARMLQLQKKLNQEGMSDVQLVTVTFDPEYDTPGILNEYAIQRGAHFKNLDLVTGDPQAIENLMKQFGILTIEEDGTINHTMATVLTDGNGMVIYRKDGSLWSPAEFMEQIRQRKDQEGA